MPARNICCIKKNSTECIILHIPQDTCGQVLGCETCSIQLEYTARVAESGGGGGDGVCPLSCSQASLLV